MATGTPQSIVRFTTKHWMPPVQMIVAESSVSLSDKYLSQLTMTYIPKIWSIYEENTRTFTNGQSAICSHTNKSLTNILKLF